MTTEQSVFTSEDIQTIFNDFGVESIKTFYKDGIYIHPIVEEKLGKYEDTTISKIIDNLTEAPGVLLARTEEFGFPLGTSPEGYIDYEYDEDDIMTVLRRNQCCPFMVCTEDGDEISVVMTVKIKAHQQTF